MLPGLAAFFDLQPSKAVIAPGRIRF